MHVRHLEPLDAAEVIEKMSQSIPGFGDYLENGQIEIIPDTEWYMVDGNFDGERVLNGWVEKLRKARSRGYSGLRLSGNTFWLEKSGWRDFLDYEKEVNDTIGQDNMIALCTYTLDRCDTGDVLDVMSTHQFAMIRRRGEWRMIENFEHRRAEEKIRHAASFPELNPCPIFEIDSTGNVTYSNPATDRTYPDLKTRGTNHPLLKGVEFEQDALSKAGDRQLVRDIEINGVYYQQTLLFMPERGTIRAYCREITERKRMEEALRHSEMSLAEAQQIAHVGSWEWDILINEVRGDSCNETYRLLGIPLGTPANYESFISSVHPDDRDAVEKVIESARRPEKHPTVLISGLLGRTAQCVSCMLKAK